MWNRSFALLLLLLLLLLLTSTSPALGNQALITNASGARLPLICNFSRERNKNLNWNHLTGYAFKDFSMTTASSVTLELDYIGPNGCTACLIKVRNTKLDRPVVKLLSLRDAIRSVNTLTLRSDSFVATTWGSRKGTTAVTERWNRNLNEMIWPKQNKSPCVQHFSTNLNAYLKESTERESNRGYVQTRIVTLVNGTKGKITGFIGTSVNMSRGDDLAIMTGQEISWPVQVQDNVAYACHLKFHVQNETIQVDMTITVYARYEISVGLVSRVLITEEALYYARQKEEYEKQIEWIKQHTGVYPPVDTQRNDALRTDAALELLAKVFGLQNN